MEKSDKKKNENKEIIHCNTFPVPFAVGETKENITITTNKTLSKLPQEQIINLAIKFHSKGNLKEAAKYYQLLIKSHYNQLLAFWV